MNVDRFQRTVASALASKDGGAAAGRYSGAVAGDDVRSLAG